MSSAGRANASCRAGSFDGETHGGMSEMSKPPLADANPYLQRAAGAVLRSGPVPCPWLVGLRP